MNRKRKMEMRPEVKAAVDDILNGTSVDSHTEWLQREYIRLMRREANYKREEKKTIESNFKQESKENK